MEGGTDGRSRTGRPQGNWMGNLREWRRSRAEQKGEGSGRMETGCPWLVL